MAGPETERAPTVPRERLLRPRGHRPELPDSRLVRREELLAGLVTEEVALAVLAAPAGYGKTTVLLQWAETDGRPFAWITLDDRYDDPTLLVDSIAAAIDEVETIDEGVFAPMLTPRPDLDRVVLPRLREALRNRSQPFALVLDDLHLVRNREALRALAAIAEAMPRGSVLALASRSEPDLGLAAVRTRRRVVELHAPDLAMSVDEGAALLEAAGLDLTQEDVGRLVERTEGWPAGLYLAALALEGEDDVGPAIERLYGDDRVIAEYLRDEFLAGLPADELDFLTRTSCLDRLSGGVCDAVLEREGSAATLVRLARSNLLLLPLDRRDHEFRHHALLREMLASELHRLGENEEALLHRRASDWYAAHGDVERAIPHAIAAGDRGRAADMIWLHSAAYESSGRGATHARWLRGFGEEQIAASPPLSLARATSALSAGDGGEVEQWTTRTLERLAAEPRADSAGLAATARLIRASAAATDGAARMGADVAEVVEVLPQDSPWRSLCRLIEGVSAHLTGERERAHRLLEEGARRGRVDAPTIETLCLAQLALLALDERDEDEAAALVDRATSHVEHFGIDGYPTQALALATAALVRAGTGRPQDAVRDLGSAQALLAGLTDFTPWYEAETRIVLARALLLLDDVSGARAALAEAGRHLRRVDDAIVLREWLEAAWTASDNAGSVALRWPLSPAELRLLRYLPTHLTFREIADEFYVSANTVKTQARSIYRKLGVSSRAEAVACARTAGLLEDGVRRERPPTPKSPSSGDD